MFRPSADSLESACTRSIKSNNPFCSLLLQNIRIHGGRDKDGNQVSFLLIMQTEESYKVTLANLVVSDNISTIVKRINELNQLELPAIKELYMEVLSNGIMSNKGGAGLGFITMALKSKNKLVYVAEDVSENNSKTLTTHVLTHNLCV